MRPNERVRLTSVRCIDTAFGQLAFAIRLMLTGEDGLLDLGAIDRPISIKGNASMPVLPDKVIQSEDDLILACRA